MDLHLFKKLFPLALLVSALLGCTLVQRLRQEAQKSGKPTVLTSRDGRFQLTIPGGWRAETTLNERAGIQAANRLAEMYVVVISESKEDFAEDTTLGDFTELTRKNFISRVESAEATPAIPVNVNVYMGMQYEVQGTVNSYKIAYIVTTVETPEHFHQILTWTLRSRIDKNQLTLQKVTESFREVVGARTQTGSPAGPPPPANVQH
ncbi:MAG TPA: hypothetical protein VGB17_04355 [Pyrinomonadaceae bacterium]|jgi:hypothetical protein